MIRCIILHEGTEVDEIVFLFPPKSGETVKAKTGTYKIKSVQSEGDHLNVDVDVLSKAPQA